MQASRWQGQLIFLALGFAVLILVSALSFFLINRAQDANEDAQRSLRVQHDLVALQLYIRRAETSQRAYLIGQQPMHAARYQEAVEATAPAIESVRQSAVNRESLREVLADIEPLINSKLDEMRQTMALATSDRLAEAIEIFKAGIGSNLMQDISLRVDRLKGDEERILADRTRAARVFQNWVLAVNAAGALLILCLAILSALLVRRTNKALSAAQDQLREANEGLEERIAERTADLQEANEEIQRFAYIVSHDLRSPLVNIMGFTSELESLRNDLFARFEAIRTGAAEASDRTDEELGADFEEALGFIKSSIGKMDRLIAAVLKLSREGRREFRREAIDMNKLFEAIADGLTHQVQAAGATIELGAVPPVISDRLALEQVFTNLLDNAVKYLRRNEPGRVEIAAIESRTKVTITVSDNGRGIDLRDKERVFELFRRSGAQDRPGEGIGLAHVRTLVRKIGGSITLESTPGKGSVFTVALPRNWSGIEEKEAA